MANRLGFQTRLSCTTRCGAHNVYKGIGICIGGRFAAGWSARRIWRWWSIRPTWMAGDVSGIINVRLKRWWRWQIEIGLQCIQKIMTRHQQTGRLMWRQQRKLIDMTQAFSRRRNTVFHIIDSGWCRSRSCLCQRRRRWGIVELTLATRLTWLTKALGKGIVVDLQFGNAIILQGDRIQDK